MRDLIINESQTEVQTKRTYDMNCFSMCMSARRKVSDSLTLILICCGAVFILIKHTSSISRNIDELIDAWRLRKVNTWKNSPRTIDVAHNGFMKDMQTEQ